MTPAVDRPSTWIVDFAPPRSKSNVNGLRTGAPPAAVQRSPLRLIELGSVTHLTRGLPGLRVEILPGMLVPNRER
jgi:hypothetical protein